MPDRADVAVRLVPLEFRLGHDVKSSDRIVLPAVRVAAQIYQR
jgi:hypothetical protein